MPNTQTNFSDPRAGGGQQATDGFGTVAHGSTLLREGETCWRIVETNRLSFIVDAADYFAAAKAAILRAERCVYLIGWEFDLDVRLRPGDADTEVPDKLRRFLAYVTKQRPDLEVFILQWDGAMLLDIARQLGPFLILKAQTKPQIHFRLDSKHLAGACHHQKIVVIDDTLAFCGGIDMTAGRWDTPKHAPRDERRSTDGSLPVAWHDMTTAVDGEAAKALGELARWRWQRATGKELPVPDGRNDIWPDELPVHCRGVKIGIARTIPKFGEDTEASEIERLWISAIASARRTIYIENQFLSSDVVADALKRRLQEVGGPEIVLVLPFSAESWLESEVMDSARSLLISDLQAADDDGRFAVYHPVNSAGENIYVHAKVLIVDDAFVRVGSSNMSNRSMCFDTECDLALEAEDQATRTAIAGLRDRLVAEHLGTSVERFTETLEKADGSLLRAIEELQSNSGPTLCPLHPRPLNDTEIALARSRLADPEAQQRPSRRIAGFLSRAAKRHKFSLAGGGTLLAMLALAQIGRRSPR